MGKVVVMIAWEREVWEMGASGKGEGKMVGRGV